MPGLDAIFAVFGEIIRLLLSWFPRPVLLNVTQRGVRFRLGFKAKVLKPGLHWYVPLFSSIEVYSLLDDAVEFTPVVLTTADNKSVAVGFVIIWYLEPDNVVKAATTTDDLTAIIGEMGESMLPALVLNYEFKELQDRIRGARGMKPFDSILTAAAQEKLDRYGVTVRYARVNFFAASRVFKLITD